MPAFSSTIEVVHPPGITTTLMGDLTTRGVSAIEEDVGNLVGETRGVFTVIDSKRAKDICAGQILRAEDQYWEVTDNQLANREYIYRNIFTKKTSNPGVSS